MFHYFSQGDSITASNTVAESYPGQFLSIALAGLTNATTAIHQYAVGGYRIADLVAQQAAIIAAKPPLANSVLSMLIGINDWINGMNTASFLAAYAAHADAMRAAGFRVIICTLTPSTNGSTWPAWRAAVNDELRLWTSNGSVVPGVHADAICDFAADPVMGPTLAASDTALYSDGTHPTIPPMMGQTNLANLIKQVIDGFRP